MEDLWFTMLIGIPGSGKSSWLSLQHANIYKYIVCPDSIRQTLTGNISDQSQNQAVWQIAQYTTRWALLNSLSVTLDAVNTNTTLRRNFISHLPETSILKQRAIIFYIDPETAIKRVEQRINGALVSADIIFRMYGEFLYTLKMIREENWDEVIRVEKQDKK